MVYKGVKMREKHFLHYARYKAEKRKEKFSIGKFGKLNSKISEKGDGKSTNTTTQNVFDYIWMAKNKKKSSSPFLEHVEEKKQHKRRRTIIHPNVKSRTKFHAHTHAFNIFLFFIIAVAFANAAYSLSSSLTNTVAMLSLSLNI